MKTSIVVALAIAVFLLTIRPSTAEACGGCVAPTGAFTAVNSHRMVIKLGIEETILWDQFTYSGEPDEFAWILPVPSPDTIVELADADFIDVMDRATTPRVFSPPCTEAGGCGGPCSGSGPSVEALAATVKVHKHEMVGPYETVVIGSDSPTSLLAWLSVNGYAFPDNNLPILNYYIEQQSTFLVLRLRPGYEVSAMQPVRIRFKGFMGQFPLRMIALGASGVVEMALWIVADQRHEASNYANFTMSGDDVVWDSQSESLGYEESLDRKILEAGGRAWATEYAQVLDGSELQTLLQEEVPREAAILTANMHFPFVTRLRTRMLVDYLDEDLILTRSEDASEISQDVVATSSVDGSECFQEIQPESTTFSLKDSNIRSALWSALLLLALALLAWRRRRITLQAA